MILKRNTRDLKRSAKGEYARISENVCFIYFLTRFHPLVAWVKKSGCPQCKNITELLKFVLCLVFCLQIFLLLIGSLYFLIYNSGDKDWQMFISERTVWRTLTISCLPDNFSKWLLEQSEMSMACLCDANPPVYSTNLMQRVLLMCSFLCPCVSYRFMGLNL